MASARTRWTVSTATLVVGLAAAFVAPGAAAELTADDPAAAVAAPDAPAESTAAPDAPAESTAAPDAAAESTAAPDDDEVTEPGGKGAPPALSHRRGHGHAYGLTERPADGGGLARGHAKKAADANAPGGSRDAPGTSGDAPGKSGDGRGKSGEAHGNGLGRMDPAAKAAAQAERQAAEQSGTPESDDDDVPPAEPTAPAGS